MCNRITGFLGFLIATFLFLGGCCFSEIINEGMILHYTFDGTSISGNNVFDLSNSHFTGTASSGVQFNLGTDYSGSAEFYGSLDSIIKLDDFGKSISSTKQGTISLRLNTDSTGDQIIIGSSYGPALGIFNKNKKPYFVGSSYKNGNLVNKYGIISGLKLNDWNHVVIVFSGENVDYYLNNLKLKPSPSYSGSWDWTGNYAIIGDRPKMKNANPHPFSGYLDEIRVYNRAISSTEVEILFDLGFNPGTLEYKIEYSRNESGNITATLLDPYGETGGSYTFTGADSHTFYYDYGRNSGSLIASVTGYTVKFIAGDSGGFLSGHSQYSGLFRNSISSFSDLRIDIPVPIANSGFEFSGRSEFEPTSGTIVTGDLTFSALFKKIEGSGNVGGGDSGLTLNDYLILHYTFDGNSVSGNNIFDQSNQLNTGIATGGVKFYSGTDNYGSVALDGKSGSIIQLNDFGNNISGTKQGTISLWLNTDSTGDQIIIGSSYGPALGIFNKNKKPYFVGSSYKNGNLVNKYGIISGLKLNDWNHVVIVFSGENVDYYLNNLKLKPSPSYSGSWDWTGNYAIIGDRPKMNKANPHPFSGYLDEIRVYNRAISSTEVEILFDLGFNPGTLEYKIEYSRNESGNITATLLDPYGETGGSYTFTGAGSHTFYYNYGRNSGSLIASVTGFRINFLIGGSGGTLSGLTQYSGLIWNTTSTFLDLGITIPTPIADFGYEFSGRVESSPTSETIVTGDLNFTAQFKKGESSGDIGGGGGSSGGGGGSSGGGGGDGRGGGLNDQFPDIHNSSDLIDNQTDGSGDINIIVDKSMYDKNFTDEMNEAYLFAYKNGITTMGSISNANMNGKLTRISMAKMLSYYAINVLGKKPADIQVPDFYDISEELDNQYLSGVTLAYQLGIMGINMPNNRFRPFDLVPRAEFGTALSRMLYELDDGKDIYYSPHLAKLKSEGILTNITPNILEIRGWGMLMMMRSRLK